MTDWENYESGPFCRHWGDPSDCDKKCACCGHTCTRHGAEDSEWSCHENGCSCEKWVEATDGQSSP